LILRVELFIECEGKLYDCWCDSLATCKSFFFSSIDARTH
jgi:hypothetical protein